MTDHGHDLQFGVFLTPAASDPGAITELPVLADHQGPDLFAYEEQELVAPLARLGY